MIYVLLCQKKDVVGENEQAACAWYSEKELGTIQISMLLRVHLWMQFDVKTILSMQCHKQNRSEIQFVKTTTIAGLKI